MQARHWIWRGKNELIGSLKPNKKAVHCKPDIGSLETKTLMRLVHQKQNIGSLKSKTWKRLFIWKQNVGSLTGKTEKNSSFKAKHFLTENKNTDSLKPKLLTSKRVNQEQNIVDTSIWTIPWPRNRGRDNKLGISGSRIMWT